MKTTIVVEDGGVATLSFGSSAAAPVESDSPAAQSESIDAGAAPAADVDQVGQVRAQASPNGATDGGTPPPWLVEAIAQAGGTTAPAFPEGTELTGLDAGSAST
jgi:hypothetical protein